MQYYSHYAHLDFVRCLGYKANIIKNYFLIFNEYAYFSSYSMSWVEHARPVLRNDEGQVRSWFEEQVPNVEVIDLRGPGS